VRPPESARDGGPLPIIGSATPVPVPAPVTSRRPSLAWVWALGIIVVALVTFAAIRGDAPRTAEVAAGTITPLPESEDAAMPPDAAAYAGLDPATEQLEVCRWDYCIVHDHIGVDRIEAFLYEITPSEAQVIADEVVADWGVGPVSVSSTILEGNLGGVYDPNDDSITLDEPLIAWSLVHEMAHHLVAERNPVGVEGHGDIFLETLAELAGVS
jgi:hypothetical protein